MFSGSINLLVWTVDLPYLYRVNNSRGGGYTYTGSTILGKGSKIILPPFDQHLC